jgi:hypothetical protein
MTNKIGLLNVIDAVKRGTYQKIVFKNVDK